MPFLLPNADHQKADHQSVTHWRFLHQDQLSSIALADLDPNRDGILFIESIHDAGILPYHKKKLVYLWSAQRHFALALAEQGWRVAYLTGSADTAGLMTEWLANHPIASLSYYEPTEWFVRSTWQSIEAATLDRIRRLPNPFFLANPSDWTEKVRSGTYRMEYFYRTMRRQTGLLMQADEPVGGQWNYDVDNRKALPKQVRIPTIPRFEPDAITREVIELVEHHFPNHFGSVEDFAMAVTHQQAEHLAEVFIRERLPEFGPYEDAMKMQESTLFHSGLSTYLNNGLVDTMQLCRAAASAYDEGRAPLSSVEGFIRQLIGWREYVRVYYEAMMPEVVQANHLRYIHAIPEMFWTGRAQQMCCLEQSIASVIQDGYAHHIQRLMVMGNFANLTHTHPQSLYLWFWYAFTDAFDWVVLPNVLGMSTYADGGVLASKPYISGGNYINKMSDYCKHCAYDPGQRIGPKACPFTYLYWNYVDDHREMMSRNPRMSFSVRTYDKFPPEEREAIKHQSASFITSLKRYEAPIDVP